MKDCEKKEEASQLSLDKTKTHNKSLDGGWGWCVVVAAFLTQFVVVGLQNSAGVIFNELVLKFNRPRGETGLVSSISVGMMFILGPLTTTLCQKFGCRIISMLGGLLCMIGMVFSAYAKTLTVMYFSFGIAWGLGTSLCYFPTMIILVSYFKKRLALANGIVGAGSGIGTLVLSPCIQWFSKSYGIKSTFLMLTGLHSIVFFSAFVYRPIHDEYEIKQNVSKEAESKKKCRPQINDLDIIEKKVSLYADIASLLLDKAFISWCVGLSIFILGYFVPFVHLMRYATLVGIPEVKASFLISTLSITATVFKIISGKVAGLNGINKLRMYQMSLLLIAIATTLVPVTRSFIGLMLYAVVFGIGESCFVIMIPLITKEIVGVRRLPLALGCVFMIMGIPTTMGAPIAGWIYDYFNDYSIAFYVAGSMNIMGVLVLFLVDYYTENKAIKNIIYGDGITSVTENKDILFIEENVQRSDSKVIQYACYGSSQRIFYTEVETELLQETIHKNKKTRFESDRSVYEVNFESDFENLSSKVLLASQLNTSQHLNNKQIQVLPPFLEDRLCVSCNHLPLKEKSENYFSNRLSFIPEAFKRFNNLYNYSTSRDKLSKFTLKNGLSITFIESIDKKERMTTANRFSSTKSSGFFIIDLPPIS